jgi:ABC-type Na+ efflux pump permease subunit
MIFPILLIAEREFRTYVATWSFWLSLALAPFAAGAAMLFSVDHQSVARIAIEGGDTFQSNSARIALRDVGRLEGRTFVFGRGGARLNLSMSAPGILDITFAPRFPLSPEGRNLVDRSIERDAARLVSPNVPLVVREHFVQEPQSAIQGNLPRLAPMTMLWLTLTGSLGMLLQAIVRERANRALESLLASTQGWEIVTGKMLGVGAVSLLVLVAWGGTAAMLSSFVHDGPLTPFTSGFSDPMTLARDAAIYVCAFAFYGSITVMLGALARDSATAQNLVRPMFVLLLCGFLAALTIASRNTDAQSWLVWIPALTPFLLLVIPPASVALAPQLIALGFLLLISGGFVFLAARFMTIAPRAYQIFGHNRRAPQPAR